jgi:hypothetical protein
VLIKLVVEEVWVFLSLFAKRDEGFFKKSKKEPEKV